MSAASIASTIRPQTIASAGTAESDGSPRNKILKLLPAAELAALVERSEVVEVKSKQVLFEPEQKLEYAYFPENCVISLVTVLNDGDQVEILTPRQGG